MTSMNHTVIDVSSDEEDDKLVRYSSCLDRVLDILNKKPKSNGRHKSNSSDSTAAKDDDCVVLGDDPYKTTAKESAIDTCENDEVLVVGQKGEIACRDFPHPRHACAKYPFKSTSHQKYCEMCHCYVCETRAPCVDWCTGLFSIDHCHANDKEQVWKNQRESIRTGEILPLPVSKPFLTTPQLQRVSQPHSVPLPQNSSSPVNKFGIRSCSTSSRVATYPNTYTRPGYISKQSKTSPQNPGLQTHTAQVFPNRRGGSYNGNQSPLAISSNPFKWTRRQGKHNIAQGSQYIRNAPRTPLQGNPQGTVTGNISTVPKSHSKVYARHFNRNMYSGNVQTSEVPSETPNHPANHQQQHQSGIRNDKILSEFEDWLMDKTTLTNPVCPLSGQDNGATTLTFDLETFFK